MSQLENLGSKNTGVAVEESTPSSINQPTIVGIGASAGGLEALEEFFDNTPGDSGLAFVVVRHLSSDFKSLMDELLARHTNMPIAQATDGVVLKPNHIYLNPAKRNLRYENGRLWLSEIDSGSVLSLPIDHFFRSLAENAAENAVAVILSGTGSDGSHGLGAIAESGGMVIVQDAECARFDGMPISAAQTGVAHAITSPGKMASEILEFAKDPQVYRKRELENELGDQDDESGSIGSIFRMFRKKFGTDFYYYRQSTIGRRIRRRMQLCRCESLDDYLGKLRAEPAETDALYRDLLVEVTEFFRDTQAFDRLREEVIPQLIRAATPGDSLRVWVPGCATGEEAYSIAMLCDHCATELGADVGFRFFATDVHRGSLEFASAGIYSESSVKKVPEELRERYFIHKNGLFHVAPALRSKVVFAPHNVTTSPPFTRIDLVSCRNLLIYLEPPIQQRVLSLFHFALNIKGILFLGAAESLGDIQTEFEVINSQWRIFRKLRDVRLQDHSMTLSPAPESRSNRRADLGYLEGAIPGERMPYTPPMPHVAEALLRKYLPPSLVVNSRHELLHTYGDARRLLSPPDGKPTLDVVKLVEGELRTALSSALCKAADCGDTVVFKGVRTGDGNGGVVRLTVDPYDDRGTKFYLISLEPMEEPVVTANEGNEEQFDRRDYSSEQIDSLRRELEYTRESLQATVEELETSNQELQGTNEELYTVDSEHQRKIVELTELTGDMDNLLRSTDVGTIYLDRDLNIRKFTPAVAMAFHVLPQDIGRPIEHIANKLDHPELLDDVRGALATGDAIEREVRTRDGIAYLMRIQPYSTAGGEIEGVVLTCVDVSAIKSSYESVRREAMRQELTDHDLQEFAYAVSHDLGPPLRHISDHVGRLGTTPVGSDGQRRIGNKEQRSLEILKASSTRLQDMIQSMLAYSRVVSRGNGFGPVGLESLLAKAIEELAPLIRTTGAVITHDPLPELIVDGEQIAFLFTAILDNAIRYCDRTPVVHVGAKPDSGISEWTITVKDNGIGIRPQHLERVFVMFQRLGFYETAGAGVGLALCKRIVHRHDGKVWIESLLESGTTCFVRLPADAPKKPGLPI